MESWSITHRSSTNNLKTHLKKFFFSVRTLYHPPPQIVYKLFLFIDIDHHWTLHALKKNSCVSWGFRNLFLNYKIKWFLPPPLLVVRLLCLHLPSTKRAGKKSKKANKREMIERFSSDYGVPSGSQRRDDILKFYQK